MSTPVDVHCRWRAQWAIELMEKTVRRRPVAFDEVLLSPVTPFNYPVGYPASFCLYFLLFCGTLLSPSE